MLQPTVEVPLWSWERHVNANRPIPVVALCGGPRNQRGSLVLFSGQKWSVTPDEVVSRLQVDLLLPHSQLLLSPGDELPDSCLAFRLPSGPTCWYLFSEARQLRQTRTQLVALIQVRAQPFPSLSRSHLPNKHLPLVLAGVRTSV